MGKDEFEAKQISDTTPQSCMSIYSGTFLPVHHRVHECGF
jgi:hypothetical protein